MDHTFQNASKLQTIMQKRRAIFLKIILIVFVASVAILVGFEISDKTSHTHLVSKYRILAIPAVVSFLIMMWSAFKIMTRKKR